MKTYFSGTSLPSQGYLKPLFILSRSQRCTRRLVFHLLDEPHFYTKILGQSITYRRRRLFNMLRTTEIIPENIHRTSEKFINNFYSFKDT